MNIRKSAAIGIVGFSVAASAVAGIGFASATPHCSDTTNQFTDNGIIYERMTCYRPNGDAYVVDKPVGKVPTPRAAEPTLKPARPH